MTIYAFGKGDLFGITHRGVIGSSFGGPITYTNPSHEVFYSKYGLCIPLSYDGIPAEYILDDLFPDVGGNLKRHNCCFSFLHVPPDGRLFKLTISRDEDTLVYQTPIIDHPDSWWMVGESAMLSSEEDKILGFLSGNPSEELCEEFFFKHLMGLHIKWFTRSEVVERYTEKPKED